MPNLYSKRTHRIAWLIVLPLLLCFDKLPAQDIENLGQQVSQLDRNDLKINGGLTLSNAFYWNNGIDPRRDALQWRLQARLNLSLLGINAPFNLSFSDGNQQFNLPSYTFVGISPTYKWASLHLGDRSLNFSKYTLSGINFRGIGTVLKPGKFNFSAMYGRLRRAVAEDFNSIQNIDPSYERWGWGIKGGISTAKYEYSLIYFSAWDDDASILTPVNANVLPGENKILSLVGRQRITSKLVLDAEIARSAFNRDRRAAPLLEEGLNNASTLYGLFRPNSSGSAGDAFNASLSYFTNDFSVRLGYERIDRGYRTLGAIFFNNDQDYTTLSLSKSFLQNQLTVFLKGGVERTNLDETESISTDRWVGSANINYVPSAQWIFSTSYSNFRNSTKLRTADPLFIAVDSIFLAQLTQTASFSSTYIMGTKSNPASLSLILSQQSANSVFNDDVQEDSKSEFFNGSLVFTQQIKEKDLRFISSINLNKAAFNQLQTLTFSPTIGLRKQFLNRQLNTDIRLTFNTIYMDGALSNTVWNLGLGTDYQFWKDHSLGLTTSFIRRTSRKGGLQQFNELYGRVLYGYRFSSKKR